MKKRIILFLSMIVFSSMLFANGTSETTKDASTNNEPSKVLFWSYMGGDAGKALSTVVQEYNESQNKYNVEIEYVPFGDMKKKYSMGMVADELPDIGIIDNPDMAAFANMGLFEDITSKIESWGQKDNYYQGPLKSAMLDNKYYGLPMTSNCLAMFYNKKVFEEYNLEVPTTWDELLEVGKIIKTDEMYPLAISAVKTEEGVFQYLPWYLSTGASVEKVDSKESIRALEFFEEMLEEGIMSPEVISWNQYDINRQFISGKAAMMINGPWNAVQPDAPDLEFGISLVPRDKEYASVLGGENLGIIKGGNVEGAWDFLEYYSSKEVMKNFISQTGYFPPRADVADETTKLTSDPILKVFLEEMQYASPRGPSPKWPQISAALAEGLQKGLSDSYTAEEAMKDAQIKINEALK